MRINNNIQALNAYRNLSQTTSKTSKNLEKLSSGLRINRASDDAAGLAISEKMRSQIRGLKMAERNALDGVSLLQTAEGAMQEVHAMLQRMRELAVQAANDSNTGEDRVEIQREINELLKEIDSITEKTEFNTRKLLNGESAVNTTVTPNAANVVSAKALNSAVDSRNLNLIIDTVEALPAGIDITQAAAGIDDSTKITGVGNDAKLGQYTIIVDSFTTGAPDTANIEILDRDGFSIGKLLSADLSNDVTIGMNNNTITLQANSVISNGTAKVSVEKVISGSIQTTDTPPANLGSVATAKTENGKLKIGDFEIEFKGDAATSATNNTQLVVENNGLIFQIGANANQNLKIDIAKLNVNELGIDGVTVTTRIGANQAINTIEQAINTISSLRSKLGAVQNRLEHTINNLQTTSENLTASESRIRDADMALEMTEFTKNNILNQAGTAMLAQANQLPQGVLQLLQ